MEATGQDASDPTASTAAALFNEDAPKPIGPAPAAPPSDIPYDTTFGTADSYIAVLPSFELQLSAHDAVLVPTAAACPATDAPEFANDSGAFPSRPLDETAGGDTAAVPHLGTPAASGAAHAPPGAADWAWDASRAGFVKHGPGT